MISNNHERFLIAHVMYTFPGLLAVFYCQHHQSLAIPITIISKQILCYDFDTSCLEDLYVSGQLPYNTSWIHLRAQTTPKTNECRVHKRTSTSTNLHVSQNQAVFLPPEMKNLHLIYHTFLPWLCCHPTKWTGIQ